MKKIHFSNVNFESRTGPNTFASRLAKELYSRGYKIVDKHDSYDVFLCFIEPDSMPIAQSKFIQRLDGIWFKPDEFEKNNRNIKWAYDNCDHVIWQSNFDKSMTQKWWGEKEGSVIHNGIKLKKIDVVNEDILRIKSRFERIFVCAANWHRQKRLKENVDFFKLNSSNNDVLIVLGNNPDSHVQEDNILYCGNVSHDLCLQIYAIADWFVHLAWLDHCPNVVVEALSQGCKIICTNSGGTHEIVKNNGIILEELIPYSFDLCDYDNPPKLKLKKIDLYSKIMIENDYLCIKKVTDKYLSLF